MRNIIGLDIGLRDIKLANITLKGKNVELSKLDVVEVSQAPNQYEIINLLKLIFKNNQLKSNVPVCISIGIDESYFRVISVRSKRTKKLKDVIKDELKKNIVLSLEDCLWDYSLLRESPKEITNDVLAVVAKKEVVLDKVRSIEQSNGFKVHLITLDILAAYNCLKFNTELATAKRYALVDISSLKSEVLIFDDKGNFWLKAIPFGEEKFIEAIAKKLGISLKEAQEYKKKVLLQSNNLTNLNPDEELIPLMKNIAAELDKTFNYYYFQVSESSAKDAGHKKIDEILLSGSGSLYPGLDKFLIDTLNIPTRYVYPLNKILIKDKKLLSKKNLLGVQSSEFTTAVGLALTGLNAAKIRINLLKQTKKSFLQKIKLSYVYNSLIILCVGLLVFLWTQRTTYNKEIKMVNSRLKDFKAVSQELIPQINNLKAEYENTDAKVKTLKLVVNNRNTISRILYKMSEIISEDIWITNFIFNLDYKDNSGELTLSGKSLNYAAINKLISGLKDTGYFKTIQPVSSKVKIDEITKEEVVGFIIKLEIGKESA